MKSVDAVRKIALCSVVLLALVVQGTVVEAGEPIKIGAFFALSGPAASIGEPTKLVAQMVVDKSGILRFAHYGNSMSDIPATGEMLKLLEGL